MFALATKVEQNWDVILNLRSNTVEMENRDKGLPIIKVKVVTEYLLLL